MNFGDIRRVLLALACAVVIAGIVGCGGADDGGGSDESAEDVAQAYVDARNQRDPAALCELYIDEIRAQTPTEHGCESFVRERMSAVKGSKVELVRVDEQGETAIAAVSTAIGDGSPLHATIPLQRDGDEWAIAGVDFAYGL